MKDDRIKGQYTKAHSHGWQSNPDIEFMNLVSDEEENLPATSSIRRTSEAFSRDNGSSKTSRKRKAQIQRADLPSDKKFGSEIDNTINQDRLHQTQSRSSSTDDQNTPEISLAEALSTAPSRPLKALGIRIPSHIPDGWRDYAPNTGYIQDSRSSSLLQPATKDRDTPIHSRDRHRQPSVIRSPSTSSSETDQRMELKTFASPILGARTPPKAPKARSFYTENKDDRTSSGSNTPVARPKFSPMVQSWRMLSSSATPSKDTDRTSRAKTLVEHLRPNQELHSDASRERLRPRAVNENSSHQRALRWKVKHNNHPFMVHLGSLKENIDICNDVDDDPPPSNFKFISKNIFAGKAVEPDPAAMYGCSCRPNCDPKTCICIGERNDDDNLETWGLPCNISRHLTRAYLNSRLAIHECNAACACSEICRNRNITLPHDLRLEVFKTISRGWGLRSWDLISKGQFVDTYRGEILTDEEAISRSEQSVNKNVYLFALDKFASELPPGEKEYVIDAEFLGSAARFINHSCDPNLRVLCISLLRGNPRVYELALFAVRDIAPGEELTFDYQNMDGDDDRWNKGSGPESQGEHVLNCLCEATQCRRRFW